MQQHPQNEPQMPGPPKTIDFDDEDRRAIGSTGVVVIVAGALTGLVGLMNLPSFTNTLYGILYVVVAVFLFLAGFAIRALGQPSQADYQNLMTSLRRLRVAYILQGVAIIVLLVCLALVLLYLFVMGGSGLLR